MPPSFPRLIGLCILLVGQLSATGDDSKTTLQAGEPGYSAASTGPFFAQTGPTTLRPPSSAASARKPTLAEANASAAIPKVNPQVLLQTAIQTLLSHRSVSAEIRSTVSLFDQQLIGSGIYLEQGQAENRQSRLELTLKGADDQKSSLVQVVDGRFLWTYRKVLDKAELRQVDIGRVYHVMERSNKAPLADTRALPGLGGLPRLLQNLDASFDFTSAELGLWGKRKLRVWQLEGHWKPEALARVLPKQKEALSAGKPVDLAQLPPHLPDRVSLLLGQADHFPYRIEYHRGSPLREDKSPRPPLVDMELFQPVINAPIDPHRFIYNPGDQEKINATDSFLESLGLRE